MAFLSCSLGCAHSTEIKTAAQLQLTAQAEAEQAAAGYVLAVDRLLARASELQDAAQLASKANEEVDRVAIQEETDILKASDEVAQAIFARRSELDRELSALEVLRRDHRKNLESLLDSLRLLQRSQELIVQFLTTDIGPSDSQISELRQQLEALDQGVGSEAQP